MSRFLKEFPSFGVCFSRNCYNEKPTAADFFIFIKAPAADGALFSPSRFTGRGRGMGPDLPIQNY